MYLSYIKKSLVCLILIYSLIFLGSIKCLKILKMVSYAHDAHLFVPVKTNIANYYY